ncbi:MAG: alpha/beta fold hydrolase, partial [Acidobacteriota bacterium]
MSGSALLIFTLVAVAFVVWRSGVLNRWQEGRDAKDEAGEADERSRQREERLREKKRRAEEEEKTNRLLSRLIPSATAKRTMLGRTEIHSLEVAGKGGGHPIFMLHGFAGRKEDWGPAIERLAADGHRIVAPDLPGCGASPAAEGDDHDVPAQTRRVRALAEKMGLLPCHLVGAGIGGTLAMLWAARNPENVASLTLIEPFGFRVPWP